MKIAQARATPSVTKSRHSAGPVSKGRCTLRPNGSSLRALNHTNTTGYRLSGFGTVFVNYSMALLYDQTLNKLFGGRLKVTLPIKPGLMRRSMDS